MEPPPRIGSLSQTDFIQGIGKREEQFIIILNINRVFSSDEVVLLGVAADEDAPEEDEETVEEERADE